MENAKPLNLYEKLLAVQSELKAPKSQFNQFGKYKYRNVEDILEAAKPLCAAQKALIYLSDRPEYMEGRFYIRAEAVFLDAETGEKISVTGYAREDDNKKGMDGSQITGAASSYARKYALGGLLDVDDGKDSDDMPPEEKRPQEKNGRPTAIPDAALPLVCADCGKEITRIQLLDGGFWTPKQAAEKSVRRYGRPLCKECMKKAENKTVG